MYTLLIPPPKGVLGGRGRGRATSPASLSVRPVAATGSGSMHQYVWQPMVRPYRASRAFPTVVSRPVAGAVRALPMQAPCGS